MAQNMSGYTGRMLATRLFFTALIFLCPLIISAQTEEALSVWFQTQQQAKRYEGIKDELGAMLSQAGKAGIPITLLIEKMNQGASKQVLPESLLKAMDEELARLISARNLIEESGIMTKNHQEYQQTLKFLSVSFRSGLEYATLNTLFAIAAAEKRPLKDTLALCSVLIKIASIQRLKQDDYLLLGKALVTSRFPESAYDSIASFFLKANASGIKGSDTILFMAGVIEKGGGLIQMEQELARRTRKK